MLTGIHAENHIIGPKHAEGRRNRLKLRPKHLSVRNKATCAAQYTDPAITKTTWVGRIEVITDNVQRVYWHSDTAEYER